MDGILQKPTTRLEFLPKQPMTNEEKEKYLSSLPAYLLLLHQGENIPVQSKINLNIKPEWINQEMIKKGQQFALRNEHALNFINMISFFIFFANPQGIKTMIFTGRTIHLTKAYQRYISTGERVTSWYQNDLFDCNSNAFKNIKYTRDIHETVRQQMNNTLTKTTLKEHGVDQLEVEFFNETITDMEMFSKKCPLTGRQIGPIDDQNEYFSQMNMVMTQFGFVAFPILYPKIYGIHHENEDDFQAFIHLWRTIGYMIGIEDRFNLCNGNLSEVRERCKAMIIHWVRPSLACITQEWSHMSHLLAKSVQLFRGTPYALPLLFLFHSLNIPPKSILKKVKLRDWLDYYFTRFLYYYLCRITFIKNLFVKLEQNINQKVRNNLIRITSKDVNQIEKKQL